MTTDNTQAELDELLDRLMQYSYDYGSGNIPTSENPPLIVARQAKQAINSLIKELVAEVKPNAFKFDDGQNDATHFYNKAVSEYQQNLLKQLEEV